MFTRRVLVCGAWLAMSACESAIERPSVSQDAAVYEAVIAAWRVRSGQFGITRDTIYTPAEKQLIASIEEPSDAEAMADIDAFAAGVGLHYSRDTAFGPQVRMQRVDSLYHPFPVAAGAARLQRRRLALSKVVYVDGGQSALVYISYNCCVNFGYESLLRLRFIQPTGWVLIRDQLRLIS
jgi:hypothetical protein